MAAQRKRDIFAQDDGIEKGRILEQKADLPAHLGQKPRVPVLKLFAWYLDLSAIGLNQSGQDLQRDALAGADAPGHQQGGNRRARVFEDAH